MTTRHLKLSSDRKVSTTQRWEVANRRWKPDVQNAFGLPPIVTCPGSTPACEAVCYAARTPYPSAHRLLAHNYDTLREAGTVVAMVDLLDAMVATYRRQAYKRAPDEPMAFRIHWSGDYFSPDYVKAWVRVIRANPDITFWSYTRTLEAWALGPLSEPANHTLYLSCDVDNIDAVYHAAETYGLPVAMMSVDAPDKRGEKRYVPCPVDVGNRPMVTDRGDGRGTGACITCGLCLRGDRDIWFPER